MIYLGDGIDLETHRRVLKLLRLLESEPIPGVRNLHPAYCSILIVFDPVREDHESLEGILTSYLQRLDTVSLPHPRVVEIPVSYGGEHGPDLNDIAARHGMSPERVVELHSSATMWSTFWDLFRDLLTWADCRRNLPRRDSKPHAKWCRPGASPLEGTIRASIPLRPRAGGG